LFSQLLDVEHFDGSGKENYLKDILDQALEFGQKSFATLNDVAGDIMRNDSYDILLVIWREISECIIRDMPEIFSPGVPDQFHEVK
jgi:hypothetical protein